MASYAITDNGEYIDITDGGTITRSLKKKYITMSVDEPYLYLNVHEKELRPQTYQWKIDFNDVTAPVVASAAALEAAIQLMITGSSALPDGVYDDVEISGGGTVMRVKQKANRLFNHFNLR